MLSGYASSKGFIIWWSRKIKGKIIQKKSSQYGIQSRFDKLFQRWWRPARMFLFGLISSLTTILVKGWLDNMEVGTCLFYLGLILFFSWLFSDSTAKIIGIFLSKELRQWHGCEHKVINMLQSNKCNLDDLRKSNRYQSRCGTFAFNDPRWGASFLILMFIIVVGSGISPAGALIALAVLLVFNLFYGPYFVQKFFLTAEPSEEKLREGLRVAKEFLAEFEKAMRDLKKEEGRDASCGERKSFK